LLNENVLVTIVTAIPH